jgi:hypothetical protein
MSQLEIRSEKEFNHETCSIHDNLILRSQYFSK